MGFPRFSGFLGFFEDFGFFRAVLGVGTGPNGFLKLLASFWHC